MPTVVANGIGSGLKGAIRDIRNSAHRGATARPGSSGLHGGVSAFRCGAVRLERSAAKNLSQRTAGYAGAHQRSALRFSRQDRDALRYIRLSAKSVIRPLTRHGLANKCVLLVLHYLGRW